LKGRHGAPVPAAAGRARRRHVGRKPATGRQGRQEGKARRWSQRCCRRQSSAPARKRARALTIETNQTSRAHEAVSLRPRHPSVAHGGGLVLAFGRRWRCPTTPFALPGAAHITDHYAADAQEILDHLGAGYPGSPTGLAPSAWALPPTTRYFDEPALSVMLCELPSDQYRVFSGVAPLAFRR
jgi:hypothetical protein